MLNKGDFSVYKVYRVWNCSYCWKWLQKCHWAAGVSTYNIVFVFPLHLREIHAAVVGLPPLLTILVLHTITQYIQFNALFATLTFNSIHLSTLRCNPSKLWNQHVTYNIKMNGLSITPLIPKKNLDRVKCQTTQNEKKNCSSFSTYHAIQLVSNVTFNNWDGEMYQDHFWI